jgi:hypothetical protein
MPGHARKLKISTWVADLKELKDRWDSRCREGLFSS